jgi:hypothetical protein
MFYSLRGFQPCEYTQSSHHAPRASSKVGRILVHSFLQRPVVSSLYKTLPANSSKRNLRSSAYSFPVMVESFILSLLRLKRKIKGSSRSLRENIRINDMAPL